MSDTLRWVKFSNPTWTADGEGFYYGRYPKPKEGEEYEDETKAQKIYYHEVGTPQSEDRLVYERPDNPKLGFGTDVTHDGRYLIISASEGTSEKTELYLKDLSVDDAEIRPLITGFDASCDVIGVEEQTLYVQTNLDAPNRRVVAIDLTSPDRSNWRTIVPESDAVLQVTELVGGKLAVQRLKDVKGRLAIYSLDGTKEAQVDLPTIGTVGSVSGDPDRSTFYYGFTSFTYPTTIFKYDLDTDDRVVPSHSYKFAAAMQSAQAGDAPILLRVETDTGHGGGTPTSKEIEETTDVFAFLVDALEMEVSAFSASSDASSE